MGYSLHLTVKALALIKLIIAKRQRFFLREFYNYKWQNNKMYVLTALTLEVKNIEVKSHDNQSRRVAGGHIDGTHTKFQTLNLIQKIFFFWSVTVCTQYVFMSTH